MKEMSEEMKLDIRIRILARALQLHEENEKLKKEVASRRRQADIWRKRCIFAVGNCKCSKRPVRTIQRPVSGILPGDSWPKDYLSLNEQKVFAFSFGTGGKTKLDPAEIAKVMGLPYVEVSKLRASIMQKLQQFKDVQRAKITKQITRSSK